MKTTLVIVALVMLLAITVVVVAWGGGRPKKSPERIKTVGPFEVVIGSTSHRTGWNEGRLGWASMERYSLRHRGTPLAIEGKAGMFGQETRDYETVNMIVTFGSKDPALIVNVGDPNNSSFYYLVHERDGQASIEYVCDDSGGISWAGWLDPPSAEVEGSREISDRWTHLEGGRYLLLGDWCVLDTATMDAHPFTWSREESVNGLKVPLGMSPDRSSFARQGWSPENEPVILVFDFIDDVSYALPIRRATQRFGVLDEIDPAWLDYHFEWVSGDGGSHHRLAPRAEVTPLPWKGVLSVDETGYREYNIQPVVEALRPVLIEFFRNEMGAELEPRAQYSTVDVLAFGARRVNVSYHDKAVGIWMERSADTGFVEELAARIDELLATGTLDEYFLD